MEVLLVRGVVDFLGGIKCWRLRGLSCELLLADVFVNDFELCKNAETVIDRVELTKCYECSLNEVCS